MKYPNRPHLLILLPALVASACMPDAPSGAEWELDASADSAVDSSDALDTTNDGEAQIVPAFDGIWLQYAQTFTCVDFIGQHNEISNRTLHLVEVRQDTFGTLTEVWTPCDIELTELYGLLPTVPPALLSSLEYTTRGGLVTGTAVGGTYSSGGVAELWGYETADPVADTFPDSPEDSRIVDTDGDGQPGATLIFGNDLCRAWMAQRTSYYFDGGFTRPDRVEGVVNSLTRQLRIGASVAICGTQYETRANPDPGRFTRIRVDGQGGALNLDLNGDGAVTCEDVPRERLHDFLSVDLGIARIPNDDVRCAVAQ